MCPSEHFLSCAWRLTREVSTVDTLQKTSNCYRLPGIAGGPPYGLEDWGLGTGDWELGTEDYTTATVIHLRRADFHPSALRAVPRVNRSGSGSRCGPADLRQPLRQLPRQRRERRRARSGHRGACALAHRRGSEVTLQTGTTRGRHAGISELE